MRFSFDCMDFVKYLTRAEIFAIINASGKNIAEGKNMIKKARMIALIKELDENTPCGIIVDADTILVDLIEDCDYEFSGFAQDVFNIWKNSTDKESVEQMFFEFTGVEFEDYLEKCIANISR